MKRQNNRIIPWLLLTAVMMAVCLTAGLPALAAEETPTLLATSAVVLDVDSGECLYSKGSTDTQSPGGLTKIMTALVTAEQCDLDEMVSFSEIMYEIEEGSSKLGLSPGEEIRLYDAVCAVLLGAANDVANGLAEHVAGSLTGFADLMNAKAEELGCVNTHFVNPHGLYDENQYTCADDLARIARAAYENEALRPIFGLKEYSIGETNLTSASRRLINDHQMLQDGSECYEAWCVGGKASYTSQSLNTIVSFGNNENKTVLSVLTGVEDISQAYYESAKLVTYGFDNDVEPMQAEPELSETEEEKPQPQTETPIVIQTPETTPGEPQTEYTGPETVLELLEGYFKEGPEVLSAYAKTHFETVFIAGCVFLIFLLILIVVLIMRKITDSKIRRRQRMAEEMRYAREDLIERMTVEEVEEELRKKLAAQRDADDEETPRYLR